MMSRELAHLLLVTALLGGILAVAELLQRSRSGRPESRRKLVHALSGLAAAGFPWLFTSASSVATLCAGYAFLMAWTARRGGLRSVHGVGRRSGGGLLYPAAVLLVFLLAREQPAAYVAAILVLALADAAAALVGSAHGRIRYRTPGGARSVEGSLAFLLVALPCLFLPLWLLASFTAPSALAWSLLVALLACAIEAVAPGGSDNLLVPVGCCLALLQILQAAAHGWVSPPAGGSFGVLLVMGLGLAAVDRRHARTS